MPGRADRLRRPALSDSTAARLAQNFDLAFSLPAQPPEADLVRLLGLRVAGELYACRLSEVSAVVTGKTVTPVPSPIPELLGIASFRGSLVPVYDLAGVLGYAAQPESGFLLLTQTRPQLALACGSLDGDLRVSEAEIVPESGRAHVRGIVGSRPLLDLSSILEALSRRGHS